MKRIVKKYWFVITTCVLLYIFSNLLFIGSNYWLFILINKIIDNNEKLEDNWKLILINLSITLSSLLLTFISELIHEKMGKKLRLQLKRMVSLKINSLTDYEYEQNKKGEYISWYKNESEAVYQALKAKMIMIWADLSMCFISIVLINIYVSYIITLVTIFSAIFIILIPMMLGNLTSRREQQLVKQQGVYTQSIENLISGYANFAFNNKKNIFKSLITNFTNKMENYRLRTSNLCFFVELITDLLQVILQQSVVIVTVFLYYYGFTSAGSLFICSTFSAYFLQGLSSTLGNLSLAIKGKKIVKKYLPVAEEEIYEPNLIEFNKLSINNLEYKINDKEVFKNLNLEIDVNKKYLLVGESGRGKTTLFRIIFGILDNYNGVIKLNNDLDYKEINKKDLKEIYTYIPQKPIVFKTSIRNNISLWNKNISDKKIIETLEKVNLKSLIEINSLDTIINPDFKNLSGGEIQRLAIARALVDDKQVMILDEITASLDKKNRDKIEELITSLDKTILFISHTADHENNNFDQVIKL
ncbi:ABC transporter ATP-binding protein [Spiroplasma corruscae]|uniref:ABC transporter ATP-binding protein n=1 Tax=Spiroplasma corruscae TaxID=216934 RepID=A0A222EPX9_9MOLU|nr:ABC transporter ATP-binding protein [Spiroplasma corruscae]ASP28303.1 ABC transporter ATP-binding protein [Spiroplasma corruscae]